MDVIDSLAKADVQQETILTVGAFDGVHLGHQALIGRMVARARSTGRLAALITFHPHPAMVLAPGRSPRCLTTPGEKIALLEGLGLDLVLLHPFDKEVADTPARDFMEAVSRHLYVRELWVGPDFALGRHREGDVDRLRDLGRALNYHVHVVSPLEGSSGVISSSRIRQLLAEGRVEDAARLLGRYPTLAGEVVVGARRGQGLGFPTANLEVRPERAVPANGVYAVFARLGTERFPAVANVGVRPSFDNGQQTVETHIFDFDRDIYGCDLVVEFVARLRDERRFDDIGELVDRIEQDAQTARSILERTLQARGDDESFLAANARLAAPCRYRLREIEHTADRALRVWAGEVPDLFAGAARGMYALMADVDGLVATDWREIQLQALDWEVLLVDWLNELLYLTEMDDILFVDFRIESLTGGAPEDSGRQRSGNGSGAALHARAGGVSAPITKAHIKAATFHDLKIRQDEQGWWTQITFDV
jgi:riboflavin kinase/FMN adenylyltransferase